MSKVVNLRTVRKQAHRAKRRDKALASGEAGAETARRKAEAALERERLDGHRRAEGESDSPE